MPLDKMFMFLHPRYVVHVAQCAKKHAPKHTYANQALGIVTLNGTICQYSGHLVNLFKKQRLFFFSFLG